MHDAAKASLVALRSRVQRLAAELKAISLELATLHVQEERRYEALSNADQTNENGLALAALIDSIGSAKDCCDEGVVTNVLEVFTEMEGL